MDVLNTMLVLVLRDYIGENTPSPSPRTIVESISSLYDTLFYAAHVPIDADKTWARTDFVKFCADMIRQTASVTSLAPARLALLRNALFDLVGRHFFRCLLPLACTPAMEVLTSFPMERYSNLAEVLLSLPVSPVVGQGNANVKAGDRIAVIIDCKCLLILRKMARNNRYRVIGEALIP